MRAKLVKEALNESHIGADTSWTADYKGKEITVSLKDVNNYLDKKNVEVQLIDPESVKNLLIDAKRDEKRVQAASLDYPILVTKKDGKFTKVLDGQHRVVKALHNNINKIKTRILDLDSSPNSFKFIFR